MRQVKVPLVLDREYSKSEATTLSEVKMYKITGELRKHGDKLPFKKEIKALKKEDALEHLYRDMGSRHKARKFEIAIKQIEEVPVPEAA